MIIKKMANKDYLVQLKEDKETILNFITDINKDTILSSALIRTLKLLDKEITHITNIRRF
jgi:hypothetical protein